MNHHPLKFKPVAAAVRMLTIAMRDPAAARHLAFMLGVRVGAAA